MKREFQGLVLYWVPALHRRIFSLLPNNYAFAPVFFLHSFYFYE